MEHLAGLLLLALYMIGGPSNESKTIGENYPSA